MTDCAGRDPAGRPDAGAGAPGGDLGALGGGGGQGSGRLARGAAAPTRRWHAEYAWLPGQGVRSGVLIEAQGRVFSSVIADVAPGRCPAGTATLAGFTMPGLANAHSHAFHRALRGVAQVGQGTFWTWRELMFGVARHLNPDTYLALARAVYAEMALAGITCVGEFHYLHHAPDGSAYADPNAMGRALIEAAVTAGLRITLLDACYLSGGLTAGGAPEPLNRAQIRFSDRDGDGWAARMEALGSDEHGVLAPDARAGVAIHSVRAVPADQMHPMLAWSHAHGTPLHLHLSEQPAENQACLAGYGITPAQLLDRAGILGPRTTAVHATHLTDTDIELLGASQSTVCLCPTTEADLADGIGPARELADAGCPLSLGSDSHAVIDILEEARRVELGERLRSGQRGNFRAGELAYAATVAGHACLGWPQAGELAPGALADLVTVSLDGPRLAGASRASLLESIIFAGAACDVRYVVAGGRDVVVDGRHLLVDDVPAALADAIRPLLTAG